MTGPSARAASLLACGLLLTGCAGSSPTTQSAAELPDSGTPLQSAANTCDAGVVADAGETLLLDTEGDEDLSGDSMEDLVCILVALETPTAVSDHMSSTRALDGMQTNSWGDFEARWNYHPNSGMGLTITIRD